MCGIAGVWNIASRSRVGEDVLKRMCDTMLHRGPDEEGFYTSEDGVGFGHRRLNIIDLSTGQQPLCNEDGTVWVVFNGEIYNFPEIREGLIAKGHIFKTKSDTEVIVHAYEEYGEDCLDLFRGMFAFAVWDSKKQKIFLARDRTGQKPLYYYFDNERFFFASELKAIHALNCFKKEVNKEAVFDYLSLGYIPSPKTIFKNVQKLPPAHCLTLDRNKIKLEKYWNLNFRPDYSKSEERLKEEFHREFFDAVKVRLVSDVPLGAFLSGGVDSSSIVALMSEMGCKPLITNAIGFDIDKYDETKFAKEIADSFETTHHEYRVAVSEADNLNEIIEYFDEPFSDSSAVPTYHVARLTRQNVTVALSGDGGDENLAGYRRYYIDKLENEWRRKTRLVSPLLSLAGKMYPQFDWIPQKLRGKTFLTNIADSPEKAFFNSSLKVKNSFLQSLLNKDFISEIGDYSSFELFDSFYRKSKARDHLSKIQSLDIRYYMCEDILAKVDMMTMANSLESRAPLLDHKLMEFLATVPSEMKLKGKEGKYLFKETMKSYFSEGFLERKKQGFSMPVAEWLRKSLRDTIEERVLNGKGIISECLNVEKLKNLWKDHQNKQKDYSAFFWSLFALQVWEDKYL